ncbi:MAG: tripartite tricarboxylate transporter substrate binding protein, partial [Betaproteobacteria bacterium]|nr:tripartite tricarboxylate transporter substrate binding protein [Betaproteobacteria bacterium]
MHRRMIQWQSLLFSAFMGLTICLSAFAQPSDYPNKPIKVVVTFPPGGSSDAIIRILSTRLNDKLGHPLVLDNRPGAGG